VKYTPRLPEKNDNVSETSGLRELAVLLGGLLGIVVGVYFLLGLAVDWVAPHVSPKLERVLGANLINRFVDEETPDDATRALRELADRVSEGCVDLPYQLQVHLSDDDIVNAVALPGGHIVVFAGLIDQLDSENELAFVLLHEMGHFANRDHLRGLGRALVLSVLSAAILGPDNPIAGILSGGLRLTELHFSREQEIAADEYAVQALHCAYGHVAGADGFFGELKKGEGRADRMTAYLRTHPLSGDRVEHIAEYARENGYLAEARQSPLPAALRSVEENQE
jgi:predicted Zn-dependent protease